jgi:hypothetical protein
MRWLEHIARMGKMKNSLKMLVGVDGVGARREDIIRMNPM